MQTNNNEFKDIYIEKFEKIMSFYEALSNLYSRLVNLRFNKQKNSREYAKTVSYISDTFNFINEYIEQNISTKDAINILNYISEGNIVDQGEEPYDEFIVEKITSVLDEKLNSNFRYVSSWILEEKVEEFRKQLYEDGDDTIDDLSESEIKMKVRIEKEKEINEETAQDINDTFFNREVTNEVFLGYLLLLQKRIRNEKNPDIKRQLYVLFYYTIFENDDLQRIFILSNFNVDNFAMYSEMYEGGEKKKNQELCIDIKDDIYKLLESTNDDLDDDDLFLGFINDILFLKAKMLLVDKINFKLLKSFLLFETKKKKNDTKDFSRSINYVLRAYNDIKKIKEKEKTKEDENYMLKLNLLISICDNLEEHYQSMRNMIINGEDNSKTFDDLLQRTISIISFLNKYIKKDLSVEDCNNMLNYIITNNLCSLAHSDSLFFTSEDNLTIDKIFFILTKKVNRIDVIRRGLINDNKTNIKSIDSVDMNSIHRKARNINRDTEKEFSALFYINAKVIGELQEIIEEEKDIDIKSIILDYCYKVIFVNSEIEYNLSKNDFKSIESDIDLKDISMYVVFEKVKEDFNALLQINNKEYESRASIADGKIRVAYLRVTLPLLNQELLESFTSAFDKLSNDIIKEKKSCQFSVSLNIIQNLLKDVNLERQNGKYKEKK